MMTARPMLSLIGASAAAGLAGGLALTAGAPAAWVLIAAVMAAAVGAFSGSTATGALDAKAAPVAGTVTREGTAAPAPLGPLIDALPMAVLLIGPDGAIRLANRSAIARFGLPESGQPTASMLRAPRLLDAIASAHRQRQAASVAFSLPRGGEQRLLAHVRPLGRTDDVLVAVEDETRAWQTAALHRDFVANASHELKTPLAALSGLIETLLGHARDDPAATERFLGMMSTQVSRMTRLVDDLLSLNRIELNERVAPREPQNLVAVVGEAVDALRPIAESTGVRLTVDLPEAAPAVLGDRKELVQLFRNLVENAIKYGGAGTDVRVSVLAAAPDRPGMAGVAVRDTGPGIAREHIPRLTERFYRVSVGRSRETGGTGLGLAIVKHVVNRHRGQLEIESRPGEGSCFTVWLPVAASNDFPEPVAPAPSSA